MATKLITITGFKGGSGKSVSAFHIADFLSDHGNTLLIDSDPNRTSLEWAARGNELTFDCKSEKAAMRVVSQYDYCVIDTPARPDSNDLKELAEGCDLLVLPTMPDIVSLGPMLKTAEALPDGSNYRALITNNPPRPSRAGDRMYADLVAAGIPTFTAKIRRAAGIQKAALQGCTARDMSGRDGLSWLDFERLGDEILEILGD